MRFAYFDGKRWYDLGRGVNGSVRSLAVSGGLLYAAGQFDTAGRTKANNVAVYDAARKEWRALGEGLNGVVRTLAFYKGTLYAGGDFAGGEAKYFARYNSAENKWQKAGDLDGAVSSLQNYAGRLVVSGDFKRIDSVRANHVADFDGKVWRALGEGIAQGVSSMAVNSGELVFGRLLVRANPAPADGEPATCSTSLNAWNGTRMREVHFIDSTNCDPKHTELAGIAGAGNTLVLALKNQGKLGFMTRYDGELTPYGGLVAETMTGLSRISVFAAGRGQLFFAGHHDPVRENYRKYSYAGPGSSKLSYFAVRSDFNRIAYSKVREDSFYAPFSSLNGLRE